MITTPETQTGVSERRAGALSVVHFRPKTAIRKIAMPANQKSAKLTTLICSIWSYLMMKADRQSQLPRDVNVRVIATNWMTRYPTLRASHPRAPREPKRPVG
jgi:hypothetical protein